LDLGVHNYIATAILIVFTLNTFQDTAYISVRHTIC